MEYETCVLSWLTAYLFSTVTLKVYSHFIPDTQDTALNALNNITA